MSKKFKMAEIRDFLIGKQIYFYDGFSGSSRHFTIGKVINKGDCVEVQPKNNPNTWVFISKNEMPILLVYGKTKYTGEIENCKYNVITEIKEVN